MGAPGLYIHIPFCESKCHYCHFYSLTSLSSLNDFLKALIEEIKIYRTAFNGFDTIYIGGGTPTVLPVRDLGNILEEAAKNFTIDAHAEITVEANPADLDLPGLKALKDLGINRINLGVQSFDDGILTFLGRRHNSRQAIGGLDAAGKAGFENMGLDLIYGVPGQSIAAWTDALRLALSFNPAHLSCYQLTVEAGTPLAVRHQEGKILLPDEESLADFFFKTSEIIEKAGYVHYEVANFARSTDLRSRHNQKYWDHTPYLGLGPGAHSFQGNRRWWNHRDMGKYLGALQEGGAPVEAEESLSEEQLRMEALFLGLRTKKGINLRDFPRRYGCDLRTERALLISRLKEQGMIEIINDCLIPTIRGLAMADSLASSFCNNAPVSM